MDGKMILHVYYWDKRKGYQQKISFEIAGFGDYESIIKNLRKKRVKIVSYSIEHRFEPKEKE